MLITVFAASSLLAATSLVAADPRAFPDPYRLGKMSLNQALGLFGRQDQNGYAPTQTQCGPGADCPTACGPDTRQCASNDGDLHCYTPDIGQQCCSDGSGNACDEGYYCTDNSDGTWCCPNGMSLTDCAAYYTLSGALTSEIATAAPSSSVAAPSSPAAASASVSSSASASYSTSTSSTSPFAISTTVTAESTKTTSYLSPSGTAGGTGYTYSHTKSLNGTATTSSVPLQITAGANHLAQNALPALALAAGAVLVL